MTASGTRTKLVSDRYERKDAQMSTGAGPFARRHHTVPQFYLRGFARDDQIATLRLPGKHRFLQSVKDASVVKDYYSLEGHDAGAEIGRASCRERVF